jgi:hypothetical protein
MKGIFAYLPDWRIAFGSDGKNPFAPSSVGANMKPVPCTLMSPLMPVDVIDCRAVHALMKSVVESLACCRHANDELEAAEERH